LKTTLIEGMHRAQRDGILLRTVELIDDSTDIVWKEGKLIGLRNENGEIYRAIGIAGTTRFIYVLRKLRKLGCIRELADSNETDQGFHAVLSVPDAS
jgi:hypothetical protein